MWGGTVYVADTGNHAIRQIALDGTVTTIAGSPGVPGLADGALASSRFSSPGGIAAYSDCGIRIPSANSTHCALALVVADSHNHRIRLIDLDAGIVTTIAGGGGANYSDLEVPPFGMADDWNGIEARFDSPAGLAADDAGNVFVADTRNHVIRWVNASNAVATLVGRVTRAPRELPGCPPPCLQGRPGVSESILTDSELYSPYSVAIGPGRPYTLLIADGDRMRMVTRAGQDPWAVVPPSHAVPVPGASGGGSAVTATDAEIRSFDTVVAIAGALDGDGEEDGPGGVARLDKPRGIAATLPDGRVYVADSSRCRLRSITAASLVAIPAICGTRAVDLVSPPGCGSYDPPVDAIGRMVSSQRSDLTFNAVNVSNDPLARVFTGAGESWAPSGRRVPFCLGTPPPDVSNSSNGVTLSPTGGTGASPLDVDEDSGQGSAWLVACPPGCAASASAPAVFGSGSYSDGSAICAAAVHAEAINDVTGGVVRVTLGKGYGPSAGRTSPGRDSFGLAGSVANGVVSLPLEDALRTFSVANVTYPTRHILVQTIAGAPAAILDSACGFADGQPPTAARFGGPAAVAVDRYRGLSDTAFMVVADARNNAIRAVSAVCSQPCENGGDCTGPEACTCAPGWAGADCTRPVCTAPCGACSICTGPDSCSCAPGYSGASCTIPQCMQACANGGVCAAPDTCRCVPGWFDANCTTPVCQQTCGNGGNCTGPDTCTCPAWWTGTDCRTPVCSQGCSGANGVCTAPNTCTCAPSWSGHDCSKPVCHQGYFRADPQPQRYAPPGTARPLFWDQFLPCEYRAWCNATREFECLQLQRVAGIAPARWVLQRNVSGWGAPPSAVTLDGCIALEIGSTARTPYRLLDEWGNATGYMRRSSVSQYGWGPPPPNGHPWSAPGTTSNDRQIALVSWARVPQGVYVCANGGNCTAPDYCVCAPGWTGFDCRTPVCRQGFYFPRDHISPGRYADPRFSEQGVYITSRRTLTAWEHPDTPAGKFTSYMHEHPNFRSLTKDADPAVGLSDAYLRIDGLGNETNEGWRRDGWFIRARTAAGFVEWSNGNPLAMAPRYRRTCRGAPVLPIDLRTNASAAPVDNTWAAFFPRIGYNDSTVSSAGAWDEGAGFECIDEVQLGCFNEGTCIAPDTCACAPGWAGVDCSLPVCNQTVGNVTSAPLDEVPLTLVRANSSALLPFDAPAQPGDSAIQYFKCPHNGNCTHPGVCTCEKGWAGPDCNTPLCAQECLNGGNCTAPDVCSCHQWPSSVRDLRGVPVYQKPGGSPQDTGWTGFDCGTPICVQAKDWVQNDDTGRRFIALETTANDGKSFQGGCGPSISRYAVSASRLSPRYLCGLTEWWMGNYRETWANDDLETNPAHPSVSSGGRVRRVNTPSYFKAPNGTWTQGAPRPGEGIYACHNKGSCIAPDSCTCPDGWSGPDCATPLCRHIGPTNNISLGCANGGICASRDTCVCPKVPSLLWQVHATAPRGALTGFTGEQCTKPMCTQGFFVETCQNGKDGRSDPGCWKCPYAGNCTAPDTCVCPPQWTGFDCRTPVCLLHANAKVKAELNTLDPEKVTDFEQDPCGARHMVKSGDGGTVPRGNCTRPNTCQCLCRRRAPRDSSGKMTETPWRDPLNRPIPPGFVFGESDCLDGYTGTLNPDGSFSSCHLRIYVPTWLERNSLYLIAFIACAIVAAVILYLIIRRTIRARYKRLKAERRKRRQLMAVPSAPRKSPDAPDGNGSGSDRESGAEEVGGAGKRGSSSAPQRRASAHASGAAAHVHVGAFTHSVIRRKARVHVAPELE